MQGHLLCSMAGSDQIEKSCFANSFVQCKCLIVIHLPRGGILKYYAQRQTLCYQKPWPTSYRNISGQKKAAEAGSLVSEQWWGRDWQYMMGNVAKRLRNIGIFKHPLHVVKGLWLINRISIADSVEWREVNLDIADNEVVVVKHQEGVNAVKKKKKKKRWSSRGQAQWICMFRYACATTT